MKRLSLIAFMILCERVTNTLLKKEDHEIELEEAWDCAMRRKWGNIMESKTPKDHEVNEFSGHPEKYTEILTCNLCGQLYTQYKMDKECPYCGNQNKGWLTTALP